MSVGSSSVYTYIPVSNEKQQTYSEGQIKVTMSLI